MLEQEIRAITEDGLQEKSGSDWDHLNCMIKKKDLNDNRKVCTLFDKEKERQLEFQRKTNKLYIKFTVRLGTKAKYGIILATGRM